MSDRRAYNEMIRAITLLADPEVELSVGSSENGYSIQFVRRRGISMLPGFRHRDPDRA